MKYELTAVLAGKITSAKQKVIVEKIEKIVKDMGGGIEMFEDWGKIDLSYPIKKNTSGVFLHFVIELKPEDLVKFRDKLRVEEEILRFLLIRT